MPCQDRSCAPAQRPPMPRAEEKQTLSVPRCTPVEFFDMAAPHFVHLRMHSEYSVTDGIVRIEQAVKRAAADGMPALALTDSANLFGMVKFYGAARAAGVKPIVGADCWVQNEADRDKPHRLLLLCASRAGYRRLCELLSRAWLRNQHRAKAEIARGWLQESGTDGLIALSAAAAGDVGQALLSDQSPLAERLARDWAKLFPGRYYIELQRAGFANAEALLSRSVALATRVGLPVVATHPVQFLEPEDFKAHEARVCIAQGYVLGDQRRPKLFTAEQYFKRRAEMVKLFADLPQALDNSVEIARRCNLEIELGKSRLPAFPTPPGVTVDQYLENAAEAGLARRLEKLGLRGDAAARYRRAPCCATAAGCLTSATTSATSWRSSYRCSLTRRSPSRWRARWSRCSPSVNARKTRCASSSTWAKGSRAWCATSACMPAACSSRPASSPSSVRCMPPRARPTSSRSWTRTTSRPSGW